MTCCCGSDEAAVVVEPIKDPEPVAVIQTSEPEPQEEPRPDAEPEYQFHVPIEYGTDRKPYTIGFNRGEQPQVICDRFMNENGLDSKDSTDVVTFLEQMMAPREFSSLYEVRDGRKLKIVWGRNDDPERVAQAFAEHYGHVHKDELPDIVKFVTDNTPAEKPKEESRPPTAEEVQRTKSDVDDMLKLMNEDLAALCAQ